MTVHGFPGWTNPRRTAALLLATCLAATGLALIPTSCAEASLTRTSAIGVTLAFDNTGISDDSAPGAANLDGGGSSLSAEGLAADGWAPGAVFDLADGATAVVPSVAAGQPDNALAAGQTVAAAGSGGALDFVVTSTDGATSGTGTIAYSDGTSQSYQLAVPDWWTGATGIAAVAPYRNNPGGRQVHQVSLFQSSIPLTPGKAVTTVTLPNISATTNGAALHVFAIAFAPAAPVPGLASAFDNIGISDDANPTAANLDGYGNSYSAEDLAAAGWTPGARVVVGGATVALPQVAAGRPDNVVANGQRIAVSGSGSALTFLTASTVGATSGTGSLAYTDGSTQTYSLSVPDWITGQTDTMAVLLPHWNKSSGQQANTAKFYAVTVPLASGKTLANVTLPTLATSPGSGAPALHVFGLGLRPAAAGWSGSWTAATDDGLVPGPWTNRTLRMVEHSSVGGSQVRIRLDNDFGTAPVDVGHATIAVQSSASTATGTPVTLTFGGDRDVVIPAGGQAMSDPVGFSVPADTNLLVSLYFPGTVQLASVHSLGTQDMYSSADQAGDQTADTANFPVNNTFGFWTLLSGIDVLPGANVGTVVALGDSITDGYGSDYNGNDRWPNDLARRLLAQSQYPRRGVVDEGISANQVVHDLFTGVQGSGNGGISALSRLDRDVLSQSGARTLIVLEGVNDIKAGTSPDQVISGLRQIAATAHAYGMTVIVGTITPFKGYSAWTAAYEANRQTVNSFIRSNGGAFDAVVDFDAAVRNPADPASLQPADDSGDHLHPSAAGYLAMASAVDLSKL